MKIKVGDSVLYLCNNMPHTGFITNIDDDTEQKFRYEVHWINNQNTIEERKSIVEYRKAYLEMLNK